MKAPNFRVTGCIALAMMVSGSSAQTEPLATARLAPDAPETNSASAMHPATQKMLAFIFSTILFDHLVGAGEERRSPVGTTMVSPADDSRACMPAPTAGTARLADAAAIAGT
jgi:hypothetical protein